MEKTISDDIILTLVEIWLRGRTLNLIKRKDQVVKQWLDVNDDGDITVGYLLIGPPQPKETTRKGVKITVIDA